MKRLLMIAYDFPPMLPGVRRTVAFVRYLREFGWEPVVLTVKPVRAWGYDEAPLKEFEEAAVEIHRCESLDPHRISYLFSGKRTPPAAPQATPSPRSGTIGGTGARVLRYLRQHYFCPDDRAGWIAPAVRRGRRILSRQGIDAIWTTSYPHSTHLVGLALKRRYPQIPWLADFRDGWTQNADFFPALSPRMQAKSAALEHAVAVTADAITAISSPIRDYFFTLTQGQQKPVVTLPNGFDEHDIDSAVPRKWPGFSVVYSGTLYGDRTAEPLFAAAAKAVAEHPGLARDLKLVFIGAFDPRLPTLAAQFSLQDRLVLTGPLSYLESLGGQKGADVLAALLVETPNVEIILTQKIFEYLGCRKPVLALAPRRSALARLVVQLQAGIVCDPAAPEEGARGLIELYESIRGNRWKEVASEALAPYTRRQQTGQLTALLDSLVASGAKKP